MDKRRKVEREGWRKREEEREEKGRREGYL